MTDGNSSANNAHFAEQALRELEAKYHRIIETSHEGIWILGPDLHINYVNPRMADMLGYGVEEIVGRSPFDFLLPEDHAFAQQIFELRKQGVQAQLDFRYRRKDGSPLWAIVSSNPIMDEAGSFQGLLAMVTDITARKQAEEKLWATHQALQAVIQASPLAINIIDPQGRVQMWNPAAERIFGWSEPEVVGQPLPIVPEDKQEEFRAIVAAASQGQSFAALEVRRRRKDGSLIDVSLWTTPLRDETGHISGTLALLADITERKRLQNEFLHAQKMEAVGRLAGGVAHDFNNLLTVISGYSELLLGSLPPGDPLADLLGDMRKAEDRAISLTRQLLAFSRKQALELRVVDLNAVVANMEKMLRRLIGEDIELVTQSNREVGRVKADPGQLEQVILNLAVNARDAMPHGGQLIVRTENVDLDEAFAARHPHVRPGPYVLLAIRDTGCGMATETMAHIFEPFFTTKEAGKGTGLGLATIHEIVRQSGGHIQATSIPGEGALFEVFLPRVEEALERIKRPLPSHLPRGDEVVLLVEDDDLLRSFVRKTLERLGYRILEASHGLEALRLAELHQGDLDLVLADVILPHMNGPDMCQRLLALRPDLKILYMSGYTNEVIELGIHERDFLRKPFSAEELVGKVRAVLDRATAN